MHDDPAPAVFHPGPTPPPQHIALHGPCRVVFPDHTTWVTVLAQTGGTVGFAGFAYVDQRILDRLRAWADGPDEQGLFVLDLPDPEGEHP